MKKGTQLARGSGCVAFRSVLSKTGGGLSDGRPDIFHRAHDLEALLMAISAGKLARRLMALTLSFSCETD
jgi:hypothetical protein